jgi:hypothetical protein
LSDISPSNAPSLLYSLAVLTPHTADFSEHHDENDVDEETTGHLHREIERAEAEGHNTGRPNSFLNRLISHGNDKTEKQLAAEAAQSNQAGSKQTAH